jgi:hypothetical protein
MKKLILILVLAISSMAANAQCSDTCQYKSYFMHNYDSSKYNQTNIHQQGIYLFAKHQNDNIIVGSIDSYNSQFKFEGTSIGNGNANIIGFNKTDGGFFHSGNEIELTAPKLSFHTGIYGLITIQESGNKTIIKSTNLPTSCSGQSSGTWANIGGFIKVCP